MKDHIKSIQTLRTELTATLKPGASKKNREDVFLKDMSEHTICGYLKKWIFVENVDLWISMVDALLQQLLTNLEYFAGTSSQFLWMIYGYNLV